MARKEWELLFNLSAKQNSNFSSTFKAAQSALVETQNRIQQLNKVQSDITAYQKQQQAVDSTKQRLAVLQQQYDNCLLYTSDAADEGFGVDLGGLRII